MDGPASENMACSCGNDVSWRCWDCFGGVEYCTSCCRTAHSRLPFHRVEQWDCTGFYTRSSLRMVGIVLHCGHGGHQCSSWHPPRPEPHIPPTNSDQMSSPFYESSIEVGSLPEEIQDQTQESMDETRFVQSFFERPPDINEFGDHVLTVVDTSGIHFVAIRYCCCPDAKPRYLQLYNMGLFPASFRRVRTAFTFQVLDDFLLNNRICKTAASTYYTLLRRRTSSTFPQAVPVCIQR